MLERVKYIVNLLIVALLLGAVAISRDGRIAGHSIEDIITPTIDEQIVVESLLPDGTRVIDSAPIAKDVVGYAGRTPIKLYVKGEKIERIEVSPNDETESFFRQVVSSGLLEHWNGMSLTAAAQEAVDGVSGATFTSESLIKNVQRAAQYGATIEASTTNPLSGIGFKEIIAILVIIGGVTLSFIKSRKKIFEVIQMVLNVAVLGFWCGTFLSLSQLVSWFSNGVNISMSLVVVVLLVVTIAMPLFGRKGSYCHLHCPMGSAQELFSRAPIKGIKIAPKVNSFLNKLRYYILFALLFMMWLGFGFELMDYEIFSAFIISSASNVVLTMAAIFLVLSLFVHRPYCRFICPTGALITISQQTKG